jgi:isoaspartyl peptidase/L-asparaginase-like protein (Ntn-hydrolase superfamily)
MTWAVIGTWRMSKEGCVKASEILQKNGDAADAAVAGVCDVEDNPAFHSVGYTGLPDKEGRVKLDGGFMDGDTLHFGAVGSIEGFRSPVRIARSLADREFNNFLVGAGAEAYAQSQGFERRDNLTPEIYQKYLEKKNAVKKLSSYSGHDTVCFLALDHSGRLCAATSTSGLFLKDPGRVGDTPLAGAGFYADSLIGAAAATGVGEDIMKGALSHEVYCRMKAGMSAMEAASSAVYELSETLKKRSGACRSISLICLDPRGRYGVGTNTRFPFVYAAWNEPVETWIAEPDGNAVRIHPPGPEDLDLD